MTDLPTGWCWTTIGHITSRVEITDPKREPAKYFTYVDIGSIDNSTQRIAEPKMLLGADAPSRARQVLRAGDTVFSTVRTYLRNIGYIDLSLDGAVGSTGFSVLRPVPGVNSRYLYYYSLTSRFVDGLSAQMRGTSYPAVVDGQVRDMEIPLAPAAEQERIVAVIEEQFSRLDSGMAGLHRAQQNLKRIIAALIKALVTGDLVLDSDTGVIRDSRLPELPDRWHWTSLGDLISAGPQNGLYLPASRYGSGVPILRINDFQNDWVRPKEGLKLVRAEPGQTSMFALGAGDLVINRVNSMTHLGKCMIVGEDLAGALFESNMMRIRLTDAIQGPYLALYLRSALGRSFLLKNAKWAVNQASINQSDVRATPIAIPPPAEQKRIVSVYESAASSISRIAEDVRANLHRCNSLRSSLLAAAFSGKLVAQDPTAESAAALLGRMATERTYLNVKKPARTHRFGR